MRIEEAIVHFASDRTQLIVDTFNTRFPTKQLSIGTLGSRVTTLEKQLILGLCLLGIVPGCFYLCCTEMNDLCIDRPCDYKFTIARTFAS